MLVERRPLLSYIVAVHLARRHAPVHFAIRHSRISRKRRLLSVEEVFSITNPGGVARLPRTNRSLETMAIFKEQTATRKDPSPVSLDPSHRKETDSYSSPLPSYEPAPRPRTTETRESV